MIACCRPDSPGHPDLTSSALRLFFRRTPRLPPTTTLPCPCRLRPFFPPAHPERWRTPPPPLSGATPERRLPRLLAAPPLASERAEAREEPCSPENAESPPFVCDLFIYPTGLILVFSDLHDAWLRCFACRDGGGRPLFAALLGGKMDQS